MVLFSHIEIRRESGLERCEALQNAYLYMGVPSQCGSAT